MQGSKFIDLSTSSITLNRELIGKTFLTSVSKVWGNICHFGPTWLLKPLLSAYFLPQLPQHYQRKSPCHHGLHCTCRGFRLCSNFPLPGFCEPIGADPDFNPAHRRF